MSNAQKLPFLRTLSEMMTSSGNQQAELKGRELPCHVVDVSGQIVTVQFDMLPEGINFPQITIPVATFPYIRYSAYSDSSSVDHLYRSGYRYPNLLERLTHENMGPRH